MGKLVKCKACDKDVASGAKCPNCGRDSRNFFMKHKVLTGFLVLGLVCLVTSVSSTSDDSASVKSDAPKQDASEVVTKPKEVEKVKIPTEYKSALTQAKIYSDTMHMSKAGLYDQLVSEYGGQFTEKAAQYAVDNVKADWKENALKQAKTYQGTLALSPNAVYDQLVSEVGGQFTEEEAKYAVDNLK